MILSIDELKELVEKEEIEMILPYENYLIKNTIFFVKVRCSDLISSSFTHVRIIVKSTEMLDKFSGALVVKFSLLALK